MKDIVWVEESNGKPNISQKRKRRVGKRKLEFINWGSRPLIEFLQAIGQDINKKHSRHDVASFITKYINDNGLASAEKKKKKVLCDERLCALFGKKSISRIKVHEMLEEHFAENHDDSDDELDSSDEDDGEKPESYPICQVKKVPKSCFAAVIPENIKLIYLKKSLILELLKEPHEFDCKLAGSFVRMKTDPNDIYQKNRFQLQLVTGVERSSGDGGTGSEIRLRVSNFFKHVPLSMLSDDNFSEEEIEDVRDRIKSGLLKRLTVKELELKAQMLHADITKHWIVKELSLLQKLIDRANEKGWRRELFEYLERRKMLQTPSEREKLILNIPEVIAEELVPEVTLEDASAKAEGSGGSPKSILRGNSDVSSTDASGSGEVVAPSPVIFSDSPSTKVVEFGRIAGVLAVKNPNGDHPAGDKIQQEMLFADMACDETSRAAGDVISEEKEPQENPEPINEVIELSDMWIADVACNETSRAAGDVISEEKEPQENPEPQNEVIELSDDDDESEDDNHQRNGECPDDGIWYYSDPQGLTQGPFSLNSLKRWSDANYFHSGFTVWKTGQTFADAVLLVDLLSQVFPH